MKQVKKPKLPLAVYYLIVLAVIILLNPFSTAMVIWIFVGVSMIVSAVLDIITLIVAG